MRLELLPGRAARRRLVEGILPLRIGTAARAATWLSYLLLGYLLLAGQPTGEVSATTIIVL